MSNETKNTSDELSVQAAIAENIKLKAEVEAYENLVPQVIADNYALIAKRDQLQAHNDNHRHMIEGLVEQRNELRQALEDILSRFESCISGGNGELEGDEPAITHAKQAIAKSKGGES
jgi:hypothetical protein